MDSDFKMAVDISVLADFFDIYIYTMDVHAK